MGRTRSFKSEGGELDCESEVGSEDTPGGENFNFRDVALTKGPLRMRTGRLFRCSQFHSPEMRARAGIRTVLDLRKTGKACQKDTHRLKEVVHPDWTLQRAKNMMPNKAPRCPICESQLNKQAPTKEEESEVYHIDFCTPQFKYAVFRSIPFGSAAYAVATKLSGRSPDGTMAGVVADPHKLGYGRLYILFLENAKSQMLRAFGPLSDDSKYPMMIHCIHGKDRTGILVMLIMRTCGVSFDEILNEYMLSSDTMQAWVGNRPGLDKALTTRAVLSVERRYMAEAVGHVQQKYGDVPQYLDTCGVSAHMRAQVRQNLLVDPDERMN